MTDVFECSVCGSIIYPPDERTNLQKAIDMLQAYMRVPADDPFLVGVIAEHEALQADRKRLEELIIMLEAGKYILPNCKKHASNLDGTFRVVGFYESKIRWPDEGTLTEAIDIARKEKTDD